MKKAFLFLAFPFIACQPRVESRAHMEDTSDRMSDSITRLIDSSLADPSHELSSLNSSIENKN
jgi:hypothetical protein